MTTTLTKSLQQQQQQVKQQQSVTPQQHSQHQQQQQQRVSILVKRNSEPNLMSQVANKLDVTQILPSTSSSSNVHNYDTPNKIIYKKMELLIEKMQEEGAGVPIRTVKSFMSKIPSVFLGCDLIQWLQKKLICDETNELLHFAYLLSSYGYIFPIDDHVLNVKNDSTFYRFQTPYYWPSNNIEPENTDYAVYLCKRTMQNKTRLELADYEAENLAKLQKLLSRKWEFIYMQAEAQIKVDKKRDKMERKVVDSQERAFWDVHRPAPGCVNTTECDIRKTLRKRISLNQQIQAVHNFLTVPNATQASHVNHNHHGTTLNCGAAAASTTASSTSHLVNNNKLNSKSISASVATASIVAVPLQQASTSNIIASGVGVTSNTISESDEVITILNLKKEIDFLKRRLERRYVKTSKVAECLTNYFEQYIEFDPFLTPTDPSNPWISDSTEFWDMEKTMKDIPQRRVRRWGFSIHELLKDTCGRDLFRRYLEKEYSSENLRFYELCTELRYATHKEVTNKVSEIYNEFLAPVAHCPINIDSRIMAITKGKMENPNRYTYDEAREHIFNLMTRDSYNRFLKSDIYRDTLIGAKKKKPGRLSIVRHPIDQLTKQYASVGLASTSNTTT